jgi:ABC-type cobalamin/Fe3+-siderophores transport system ATPase subunit
MRITSVHIPKAHQDLGIEDIEMNRLEKVVLMAGKNGSGKTRLLRKVFETMKLKPTSSLIASHRLNIEGANNNLTIVKNNLAQAQAMLSQLNPIELTAEGRESQLKRDIIDIEGQIRYHNDVIDASKKVLEWSFINTSESASDYNIAYYVPKRLDLFNSNDYSKSQLVAHAETTSNIGMDTIFQSALAKIQNVQDRWWNSNHQLAKNSFGDIREATDNYERLTKIIHAFLGTEIDRTSDGNATLFGFNFGALNLSDGQAVLLQYAIAVYSQGNTLNDLILFLDEPENHLHPSSIITAVDRILSCSTNGQVWISTHSIPLLAHFDPKYLWFMEEGKVSYAGDKPEKVLRSLLGDDEEVGKLQDFIGLPAQFATTRYAIECLFEPKVQITDSKDSQTLQIKKEIAEVIKVNHAIKMLDFGAGKGRLLSNIFEQFNQSKDDFVKAINYVAYDQFKEDAETCQTAIATIYDPKGRYFNDLQVLLSHHDKSSFDIIILCNVLHEIDPLEWLDYFGKEGKLTKLLKDTGLLLIVEDLQIPNGEKAYQKGFIVYDTPQLKELFNITEADKNLGYGFTDARGDSRLKAHRIPKQCLFRITPESRTESLNSLRKYAQDEIIKTRDKDRNYKNGKLHGFYVQQFANSSLALRQLAGERN